MQRIAFSSAELPAHLDDRARFSQWRDLYAARYGRLDIQRADDRPFSAQFEFAQFASLGLGQFKGTVEQRRPHPPRGGPLRVGAYAPCPAREPHAIHGWGPHCARTGGHGRS